MEFSGKMSLKIILKATKSQRFTLSLEDTIFDKPQVGGQIDPPSRFRVEKGDLQAGFATCIFHHLCSV